MTRHLHHRARALVGHMSVEDHCHYGIVAIREIVQKLLERILVPSHALYVCVTEKVSRQV